MPRRKSTPVKKRSSIVYRGRTIRKHKRSYRRRSNNLGIGGTKMIYMKARCVSVTVIQPSGVPAASEFKRVRFGIPWARPKVDAVPEQGTAPIGITQVFFRQQTLYTTERFTRVKSNWKEYSVTGLKIEYFPGGVLPVSNDGTAWMRKMSYNAGLTEFKDRGLLEPSQDLYSDTGFRQLRPHVGFRKYISMRAIAKSQHINWLSTADVPLEYSRSEQNSGWSMFDMVLNKPVEGDPFDPLLDLGNVKLTWYVTFRSQA